MCNLGIPNLKLVYNIILISCFKNVVKIKKN